MKNTQRNNSKVIYIRLISLITFYTLLFQYSAYAVTYTPGKIDNLPPYAQLDMSKKRMIDLNIADDGTTGYSTSTLNSKLNAILKPKLAQAGIDFKVNVTNSADRNIYSEPQRTWSTICDSGNMLLKGQGWSAPAIFYITQRTSGNQVYNDVKYQIHYGDGDTNPTTLCTLPTLDYNSFLYRVTITYFSTDGRTQTQQKIEKNIEADSQLYGSYYAVLDTNARIIIERSPKLPNDALKGGNFNTGKYFYPGAKKLYGGEDYTGGPIGVSGSLTYQILPDNKILIKSYSLDYDSYANHRQLSIKFYSDYTHTTCIKSQQIADSRIAGAAVSGAESDYSTGSDITVDFGDIKDSVKSFEIQLSANYMQGIDFNTWIGIGLYKDGDLYSTQLSNYPIFSDNIKRKAYISENAETAGWRDGADRFYVDFSNRGYSENTYGEGMANSLQYLQSSGIIPVKLGSGSTRPDMDKIVQDNDCNGRFIDNANLDTAVSDLAGYVLDREKVNLDLVSDFNTITVPDINNNLKGYLNSKYIDLGYNLQEAKQRDNTMFPRDRFYFTAYMDSRDTLQYYDESRQVFVNTNIKFINLRYLVVTPRGTLLAIDEVNYQTYYETFTVSEYKPIDNGVQLINSITLDNYKNAQAYNAPNYYVPLKITKLWLNGDDTIAVMYTNADNYQPQKYISRLLTVNYRTGEIESTSTDIITYDRDSCYNSFSNTYTTQNATNLGTYTRTEDQRYIITPDGITSPDYRQWNIRYLSEYSNNQTSIYLPATFESAVPGILNIADSNGHNFISYIGTDDLSKLSTSGQKQLLDKLNTNSAEFVGVVNSESESMAGSIVSKNYFKGECISHTTTNADLSSLSEYIVKSVHSKDKKLQNGSYVVVSENETPLEFEAGGINFTSGVQEVNSTAARSKDYIPVNENGTYTVGSNGSGITSVKIFTYDENVNFTSTFVVNTDSRFTFPTGTTNIKIFCPSAAPTRAEKLSLLDNDAFGGDTIKYNPTVTDNENDNSDIVYKFDHDPQKIAGQAITNPSDKLVLSGQELSVPVSKFTKPGTYVVSMYAKDIPKSTDTTENLLSDKWNTSASDISRTTFAKTPDGLQIVTDTASNGVNYNASYYQDIYVSSNTKYKLTGSLSSHNCQAQFVIYELDSGDNILNVINSSIADNQPTADILSADFVTGFNTSKLRVHILKGATTSSDSTGKDYVIADNMYLIKMLPDSRFDEYRRTSNISSSTIYAHRLPRADFSYRIQNGSGAFSIKNLADNQLSYDPDHADKQNKGIINFQWRWAEITGDGATTWHDGKLPETKSFRKGEQVIIWYRVQDTDGTNGIGAWSLPKVVKTDGSLTDPVALFIPNPNPLPMHDELEITDESYTPNLDGTIISRVWTIKKDGQSAKTLTFDRVDTANNKYYKRFNSMGFGRYTITLTVTDSFGMVSKPYSQMINVIDTINPIVSAVPTSGIYNDEDPATVSMNCADISQGNSNNRGLKTITYAWSKSTVQPQNNDTIHTVNITTEGVYAKDLSTTQSTDGTWYLYVKDEDYAGNTNNEGEYARYGPFTIETVKAGHFYITMMQDIGWRPYYFDINNGIDDDHDGEADRYPRRPDTDIGTAGLPVNYYSLVGFPRNYVKAGYKIKGKIDIQGTPDYAKFYVSYTVNGRTFSDTVNLVHASGETYTFEWVIPLETDDSSFVSFNLEVKKENIIFGNEKWADKWDSRNTSRQVLYIKGKATEDLYFYQSQ